MYFKCTIQTYPGWMVNSGYPQRLQWFHTPVPRTCGFLLKNMFSTVFTNDYSITAWKYMFVCFFWWLVVKPEPPASGRTVQASSLHTFQLNNHLKLVVLIMFTQFHPPPSNKQLNHHQLLHLLEISQPHCFFFTDFNHRKLIWVLSHLLYGDNLL